MDTMFTFLPLLFGLLVPVLVTVCVIFILRNKSNDKDEMIRQLTIQNMKMEEQIYLLLAAANMKENNEQ